MAIFRAREDAMRSFEALAARGFAGVIAPVVELVGLTPSLPPARFDFVIATSANAIAFASCELLAPCRGSPMYVVGARTAAAARDAGLAPRSPAEDVAALLPTLPSGRALYLAARDRKPDLEAALGGRCAPVVVYEARARSGWTPSEADSVGRASAALHYSARHAALAASFAQASGLAAWLRGLPHVCLSREAAAPLAAAGATRVVCADRPQEASLFDALDAAHRTASAAPQSGDFVVEKGIPYDPC